MSDPWSDLITYEDVIELHKLAVTQHQNCKVDPPKPNCVEGCLGNAWAAQLYSEEDASLPYYLIFVSYLLVYLVQNHCFSDGNKRVGWMVASDILLQFDIILAASDDEVVNFVYEIAKGNISDGNEVAKWILEHSKAAPK